MNSPQYTVPLNAEALRDAPEGDFQALVRSNVGRYGHDDLWKLLLTPDLVRRTHKALTVAYNDVGSQLGERKSELSVFQQECLARGEEGKADYFQAKGEYDAWKARVLRFRRLLDYRLQQTRPLLRTARREPRSPEEKVRTSEALFRLAWAVRQHRRATREADIKPEPHDTALWDLLDTIRIADRDGIEVTLQENLANAASRPGFTPPEDR